MHLPDGPPHPQHQGCPFNTGEGIFGIVVCHLESSLFIFNRPTPTPIGYPKNTQLYSRCNFSRLIFTTYLIPTLPPDHHPTEAGRKKF